MSAQRIPSPATFYRAFDWLLKSACSTCSVYAEDNSGTKLRLGRLGDGCVFGERAVLRPPLGTDVRTRTIVARCSCKLASLSKYMIEILRREFTLLDQLLKEVEQPILLEELSSLGVMTTHQRSIPPTKGHHAGPQSPPPLDGALAERSRTGAPALLYAPSPRTFQKQQREQRTLQQRETVKIPNRFQLLSLLIAVIGHQVRSRPVHLILQPFQQQHAEQPGIGFIGRF